MAKSKQISEREHILNRSMWAGSKTNQELEMYLLEKNKFVLNKIKYPPALYKCIDEIVVNAIDHYVNNIKTVKNINITLEKNGEISVYNDGPGIPIEKTTNLQGVEMYIPQLVFSEFRAGTNLDDDENKERIVGGQNGYGSKITSVFSKYFIVETIDKNTKLHYTQTFRDNLSIIDKPILKKTKDNPFTKITFLIDFDKFKLTNKNFNSTLKKLLTTRAYQAAAFTNINVTFNNKKIVIDTFNDYCSMFIKNIFSTKVTSSDKKFTWDLCLGITDGVQRQMSLINGIYNKAGGTHIKHIQSLIVENLKPYILKELKKYKVNFNKNLLLNNLFIFVKGHIANPEFTSQTKDSISNGIGTFKKYNIKASEWAKIWSFIKDVILSNFIRKQLGNEKQRANRSKLDMPKYREARLVRNNKKWHLAGLIITEGDSATGTADTGLKSKASDTFNYEYFGTFGIQGVPVNGLKNVIEIEKQTKKSSDKLSKLINEKLPNLMVPKKKLLDNERLSSLMKILGLDYNKTYDNTVEGNKEWKTLRYGYIAGLMDQDLDGFNIFGLLVVFIMTYWPHLITRNFIRRINTPIVRAYPKNKSKLVVKEFYTEKKCREWVESKDKKFISDNYTFKYYKGLGSHSAGKGEVKNMFKNINDKIITYILDKDAIDNMLIYYGEETKLRKKALSNKEFPIAKDGLIIPLSQQFEIDTKLYQRDNVTRKLINSVDGFIQGRRKIFYTMTKIGKKTMKVAGIAGKTVEVGNYHHGEVSAEGSIARMAQAFPQGRNLPLILPEGNFGSRSKGFKDRASSRYIFAKYNWRLSEKIFRKEDEYVLEYNFEDGERYEPIHYVPVIPYALCESNNIPGTGWVITTHARDINDILKNVKNRILNKQKKCNKLKMNTEYYTGRFTKYKGKIWYVGEYIYNEGDNTVTITSLPIDKWSHYYLEGADADTISKSKDSLKGIKHKELIEDYSDETTNDEVKIVIYLKENAASYIKDNFGNETFDSFEEYFELKSAVHNRLNLVNEFNEVIEYNNYEEIFDYWFECRKKTYVLRIERERVINELLIIMLKQIQLFSKNHDSYKITSKTNEQKTKKILKENNYLIINKGLITNPKFENVSTLKQTVLDEKYGASYDYLLNLSYRDLTKDAYDKRKQKIKDLEKRLEYLNDNTGLFLGSKIWLEEVNEVEQAIKKGIESKWMYGDNEYKFEN